MNAMEQRINGFSFLAENFHPISVDLSRKVQRLNIPTQPRDDFTAMDGTA
jgi:hypothetical protein